jgi:hypothetical protein
MQKEVLEKRQRILGDEHPDTIIAMSNLASTLSEQGQLEEAAAMQKEVLEKRQQILGDEHPHKIIAMSNLDATLSDQGKLDENALAITLRDQGRPEGAADFRCQKAAKRRLRSWKIWRK